MFENDMWFAEPFTKGQAWIDLFANANHEAGSFWVRGNEVKIERGQIGWSELTMCKRWCWSKNKVRRFLNWLETEQQIKQQKSFITSIITIVNYDIYQGDIDKTEQQTKQQKDSRRYTNKNDKNDKEEDIAGQSPARSVKTFNPLGAEIIKAFESVDPKNKTYYGNKTQRAACDFLLTEYGLDEVLKRVSVLSKTNAIPYFPSINSPNDLKEKWVKLQEAVDRKRAEKITKTQPNFIL